MNIFFTNTNCSWNKGSQAQVYGAIAIFKDTIEGNLKFSLLSHIYELDSEWKDQNEELHIVGYSYMGSHRSAFYLFRIFIACCIALLLKIPLIRDVLLKKLSQERIFQAYNTADLVVDLSGDSFADHMGGNSVINVLGVIPALLLNKPVIIFSQSVGPFKWYTRPFVRFCFNKADAIFIREEISNKHLRTLNVKNNNIFLKADCGFALKSASRERIEAILSDENVEINKNYPLIGIAVSRLLDTSDENYAMFMAKLINNIIDSLNAKVLLIPHVAHPEWFGKDARFTQNRVLENINNKSMVMDISGIYSASELKGLISLCDIFVGSYMHANIAALSSCVPTLSIGWAHKYKGIMSMVGLDSYVFDYKNLDIQELTAAVIDLWNKKEQLREDLKAENEQINISNIESGQIINELICSANRF